MNEHVVLLFPSVHDVVGAERALQKASLWCDLVPTPRDLSSNCGMSLAVRAEDIEAVRALTSRLGLKVDGMFDRPDGEWRAL